MPTEREAAFEELSRACQSDSFPELEPAELEKILDSSIRAETWKADTYYKLGTVVYPTTRNGRRYVVVSEGTSAAAEPTTWPTTEEGRVISGTVTLEEEGSEFSSVYDLNSAIRAAWKMKAAKASRFMSTGGMNLSTVFDNCLKMAEQYDVPLVG